MSVQAAGIRTAIAIEMASDRERPTLGLATLVGLGGFNLACLLAGFGAGWLVDRGVGSAPAATLAGLACGIVLGIVGSYLQIKKYLHD